MLFDWFVIGQVVPHNPAASVRGPKHVVSRGKTAVLPREDAKALIDAIETDTLIGLRDRALIGTLCQRHRKFGARAGVKSERGVERVGSSKWPQLPGHGRTSAAELLARRRRLLCARR